uniref:hypothetical protein n=1 Tax=Nitzschia ovalis TaxID=908985 RepID=UPI001EF9CE47|nr:hypothetical protein MKT70_pgp103 [Nitzschia ovalis]YP_010283001.1 hypothetical protein MKT70_pgp034 [Nitzschia ovalis]ULD15696.1 hypothetical protein [Nitzschia ovalis]ULD15765.1 hypothetical protein [Nitzschia ovalis]
MTDSNLDLYYFIKENFQRSSNLMFQQHIYDNRHEFKNYLKNFIRNKADEPLRSLDLYFQGRKDLCIQSIELNSMHEDFENDYELYNFLSKMMFSKEEIDEGQKLLAFLNQKIESLNSEFKDSTLITDVNKLRRFQQQIDIVCSEL